jgi:integrase
MGNVNFIGTRQATRLRQHLEQDRVEAIRRGRRRQLRDSMFGMFLLGTGLRVSEACGVLVGDVSVRSSTVFVRRGKGGKKRTVVIGSSLCSELARFISTRGERGERLTNNTPLFSVSGRCMSRTSAWRVWKRHLRAVGIDKKGRGCHCARHVWATQRFETDDCVSLIRQLGHENGSGLGTYVHSQKRNQRDAASIAESRTETSVTPVDLLSVDKFRKMTCALLRNGRNLGVHGFTYRATSHKDAESAMLPALKYRVVENLKRGAREVVVFVLGVR